MGYLSTGVAAAGADRWGMDDLSQELLRRRADAVTDAQHMLLEHPDAAEFLVGGADGLVDGLAAWLPPGAEAVLQSRLGYPSDYEGLMASLSTPASAVGGHVIMPNRPSDLQECMIAA